MRAYACMCMRTYARVYTRTRARARENKYMFRFIKHKLNKSLISYQN